MPIVVGIKFILIFISCSLFAFPDKMSLHYESGMSAYQNNQFELSIQEFESILNHDLDSPELYYNLGNAYYRSGNISGAIWSYESCLKIHPNHKDAKYNLTLTNLRVKDRVLLPEPPIYLKLYMSIKERFTSDMWITITLFFLLLFSISVTLSKFLTFDILHYLSGSMLTIIFICLFLTLHSIWTINSNDEGIIYHTEIEAHSEPNKFSTRLFEVHEGLKVSVDHFFENWVKIELIDGKAGWIEQDHIRLIQ
jgi:tetratricopeptide (TPR) repeat protein